MKLFHSCSVFKSRLTLCDPMDCSTPIFPLLHCLVEFSQTHVHWFNDAIQPSHPLSTPSPPALNLSQHQGVFQWVGSSHQVAKVLLSIAVPDQMCLPDTKTTLTEMCPKCKIYTRSWILSIDKERNAILLKLTSPFSFLFLKCGCHKV